jgi:hypothetical protein
MPRVYTWTSTDGQSGSTTLINGNLTLPPMPVYAQVIGAWQDVPDAPPTPPKA